MPINAHNGVSIIIVNFNAGAYLTQVLNSIIQQNFNNIEIILIDNASSDSSVENVQDWLISELDIRIIRNRINLGFAKAQNQGMRLSSNDLIMPLNFDVILQPGFIDEIISALENSPKKAGSASGKILRWKKDRLSTNKFDNAGLLMQKNRIPTHRGRDEFDRGQYDSPMYIFGAMGAAALYRREMLEDIAYRGQYFDESYFMWYEDIDLEWRGRLRGWDCLYVPSAVAYHVGDPHGHGRSPFGAEISMRNRWKMIVSNECPQCLVKNFPALMLEEMALFRYVVQKGLISAYLRALRSFLLTLPDTLDKRAWVRGRAQRPCLPDYPIPLK